MRANIKDFPVDIIDGCSIVTEPNHSIKKINRYEKQYGISTEDMLSGKYDIDECDKQDWLFCNKIIQNGVSLNMN